MNFIHHTAIIDENSQIGEGTKVWVNVQIREESVIGKNCILSKDVYVDQGVSIGDNCKIQNGVSIYNGVTIESDVFVGPNVTFTNDKLPRAFNQNWKVVNTIIKKGASLGANCTIVCGVFVGEYAMIAAGTVVTKDVEPFTLIMGNPGRVVGKVDKMGNVIEKLKK